MKRFEFEQLSPEWMAARCGLPTSSNFGSLITPSGKPSKQADEYCNRCIADIVCGEISERFQTSFWMEQGVAMEVEAADWYAFETGFDLAKVGFITDDEGRWGASPDRIVMRDGEEIGALEIKCPAPWTHVENILRGSIKRTHIPQVQGQMLIGWFAWVDWVSYHPDFGGFVVRIERDEEYIEGLQVALERFSASKQEKIARLVELGIMTNGKEKDDG